jgi:hypothetical protein
MPIHLLGTRSLLVVVVRKEFECPNTTVQPLARCHGSNKIGSGNVPKQYAMKSMVEWSKAPFILNPGEKSPDRMVGGPQSRSGREKKTPFPAHRQPLHWLLINLYWTYWCPMEIISIAMLPCYARLTHSRTWLDAGNNSHKHTVHEPEVFWLKARNGEGPTLCSAPTHLAFICTPQMFTWLQSAGFQVLIRSVFLLASRRQFCAEGKGSSKQAVFGYLNLKNIELFFNSIAQSPWEADSRLRSQEMSLLLWNPKFHNVFTSFLDSASWSLLNALRLANRPKVNITPSCV